VRNFHKKFLPLSLTLTADEQHITIPGHKATCLDGMLSKIEPGKPGSHIPITLATHSGDGSETTEHSKVVEWVAMMLGGYLTA